MNLKKKAVSLLAALAVLCTAEAACCKNASARYMELYVDNHRLMRNVQSIEGFDMLPVMDIAGELGFGCTFDGTTATLYRGGETYRFTLDSPTVYSQDGQRYGLDVVPQLIDGNLYVPAKFFQDVFRKTYVWDPVTDALFLGSEDTYNWLVSTPEYQEAKRIKEERNMYALDGRVARVASKEVPAWESVGWYTEPVIKMHSEKGKTCIVKKSEIDAYKAVGWYEAHEIALGKSLNQIEKIFGSLEYYGYWNGGPSYDSIDYSFCMTPDQNRCVEIYVPVYQLYPGIQAYADDSGQIRLADFERHTGLHIQPDIGIDGYDLWYENALGDKILIPCDRYGTIDMQYSCLVMNKNR